MKSFETCPCCGQPIPEKQIPQATLMQGFNEFWAAYPKKTGKIYCQKIWLRDKMDVNVILPSLKKAIASREWQKDAGEFIPNPSTWLNQGRWEDEGMDIKALRQNFQKPVFSQKRKIDQQHYKAWKKGQGYPEQFLESNFEDDIHPVQQQYLQTYKHLYP